MDKIIYYDQQLLLLLNGSDSQWLDNVMWAVSHTGTWIPLLVMLLFLVWRSYGVRQFLLFVLVFGLAILLADQLSATLIKPLVCRPRPSHEVAIMQAVDLVRGYRGGGYSFVSSHAANYFATATYISLLVRRRALTIALCLWAALICYSRVYLGVHYPGDVLCGALLGAFVGYVCYVVFAYSSSADLRRARFTFRPICDENYIRGTWLLVATILLTLLFLFIFALF